jgi:hypothetical protein
MGKWTVTSSYREKGSTEVHVTEQRALTQRGAETKGYNDYRSKHPDSEHLATSARKSEGKS